MKFPHLLSVGITVVVAVLALAAAEVYWHGVEAQYADALALEDFPQKEVGAAMQRAAVAQPDLLPVYGSSEVAHSGVMNKYPTGFGMFRVGAGGSDAILYAQDLASLGSEVRGKKVVISFAPGQFFLTDGIVPADYAGFFSRLHAYDTIFSLDLSTGLKQALAHRMLEFPDTLKHDAFLRFAMQRLDDGSPVSMALYDAALPFGKLRALELDLQDDWATWEYIVHDTTVDPVVRRKPARVNWQGLAVKAKAETAAEATNNVFGFENSAWAGDGKGLLTLKGTESDAAFRTRLAQSKEWGDLDLLLRVLRELGAKPLLISTPLPGGFYDYLGISRVARQGYYDRLEAAGRAYGVPVVDFGSFDEDKYFSLDQWSHPSLYGAMFYQEALDLFYHDRLRASSVVAKPAR